MSPYDVAIEQAAQALHNSLPGCSGSWNNLTEKMRDTYRHRARTTVSVFNKTLAEEQQQ